MSATDFDLVLAIYLENSSMILVNDKLRFANLCISGSLPRSEFTKKHNRVSLIFLKDFLWVKLGVFISLFSIALLYISFM